MAKKRITPKRGEIYLVNFEPALGSEIKKTRPAVILQNNVANEYSPVTIVTAVTSLNKDDKIYPTEVLIKKSSSIGLKNDSLVLLNQIRTIDKQRLVLKIGRLNEAAIKHINEALKISLGLVEI
ncbi:MAG: type II toxin-antitoxin system PemK/MazF family toxin [Candidatus Pacebacteria bacterium]|nr:type II toxin-antitoxin system PemK/MazF family toxin [Candidatus Paceibacterota bacterium]NUQ57659.1 type II toxin-antitoxin system PemK/MazF family toxin [Candidatus Paceibacter sp.]